MESHQDFRSLQAKFQASRAESSELPPKPPKPEVNKLLKKLPQLEPSEQPKQLPQPQFASLPQKLSQPEFTDPPQKPSKPEFGDLSKKRPQLEASPFPRKHPQPEVRNPARSPSEPKPNVVPKKFQQLESSEGPPRSLLTGLGTLPKKPPQPEFSVYPRKPPKLPVSGLPGKSSPQPEFSEVPQVSPSKPGSTEPCPLSPKPDFGTFPRKPLRPQAGAPPKRSLPQPEFSEVPMQSPSKPESELQKPHSPKPGFSAFPKKALKLEFGDLTRTSSEPEVSVLPKRSQRPEFKALSKKPPQPELGGLPRTSSVPEFSVLPRKFSQPECRGPPRKFSQPEPHALPKQPELFPGLPRKSPLPGSVSESSVPAAVVGSGQLGAARAPRWKSEDLQGRQPPPRRPLPPASSLGPPPAKPPLPPGPLDVQSFWRLPAAGTGVRRTRSSAGMYFQALQARQAEPFPQDPDEIYEMCDEGEPTEDPSPRPRARDEVWSTQQDTRKPPQDPELRKENSPQPQQVPSTDPKVLKQMRKAEKAEREFRKKFKFEGEIVIHTRMMIDPNAKTRRGGGKHLGIRRGEILEVIEFTNKDEMLCRDPKGKCEWAWLGGPRGGGGVGCPPSGGPTVPSSSLADGYVPRTALLPLETEVYDDVDVGIWDPLENQPFPRGQ
ncbi:PML-RARA-regulated adapter molecule 1 isoform X2 [Heterocephalus glaber]|uniref:PML-RARA-regulated adapter molecule 1 isoform X2 n=1 Tax=Heterocephalus glaber TaxID=10181 RepID=A0AAX6RVW5_HETGA|nr:PML-RARA-regulated adapter molecule 1 isoform X2 [Heterocephalus glaber]